ncbi:dihydrofolate reductase [Rubripirellula reticaptiva]|uniref:Dihydrofolate reductase n=1 Tax=Rubripirellula reticaptiva TaxID=2528013 RepID=A0A5C6F8Q3_9BACT|nr:dihydrofolate reductase [Rubripirellula reticaptiva]TWU56099.1 Dihydrofolate reductase type 3 [Rubripirellula reticaptiva]
MEPESPQTNANLETRAIEPAVIAVVAMTSNGTIGLDGDMPWRLRADLMRFKSMTMGGVLIMGRKTYDSIGRPLPGRRTIVVTRNKSWHAEGVDRASDPEKAILMAGQGPIFVVGGAEIYRQLLPSCKEIWLTRVWSGILGDTKLSIDLSNFRVLEQTRVPASDRDDVPTEFFRLVRQNS